MSDFGAGDGIPFVNGSIRGHRVWRLQGGILASPHQYMYWYGGTEEARCNEQSDEGSNSYQNRKELLQRVVNPLIPQGAVFYSQYDLDHSNNLVILPWVIPAWFPFDRDSWPDLPEQTDDLKYEVTTTKVPYYIGGYSNEPEDETQLVARGTLTVTLNHFTDLYMAAKNECPDESSHFSNCCCGFYAYYDSSISNTHAGFDRSSTVYGVVEGFGETVIGTKGFRSQKMKILALSTDSVAGAVPYKTLEALTSDSGFKDVKIFKKKSKMYEEFPVKVPDEVKDVLANA